MLFFFFFPTRRLNVLFTITQEMANVAGLSYSWSTGQSELRDNFSSVGEEVFSNEATSLPAALGPVREAESFQGHTPGPATLPVLNVEECMVPT